MPPGSGNYNYSFLLYIKESDEKQIKNDADSNSGYVRFLVQPG